MNKAVQLVSCSVAILFFSTVFGGCSDDREERRGEASVIAAVDDHSVFDWKWSLVEYHAGFSSPMEFEIGDIVCTFIDSTAVLVANRVSQNTIMILCNQECSLVSVI